MPKILEEALMWLGIWAIIFNIFFAVPLFFYLRSISREKFICIMYILHHWLQNFDCGYGQDEVLRDLAKVEKHV
jgi:hypothetical protein